MTMKNPPYPGLSVRHDCIEPLGLTITEAAEALGVTRQTLNNLVNGKSGFSADMAIRLDKAFGGRRDVVPAANGLRPRAGAPSRGRHQRQARAPAQVARPVSRGSTLGRRSRARPVPITLPRKRSDYHIGKPAGMSSRHRVTYVLAN